MPQFSLHSDTDFGLIVVFAIVLAIIWIAEFVRLMSAADEAFPGQYVRLAWVAAFLVCWPLAPFAFLYWRRGQARTRVVHQKPKTRIPRQSSAPPDAPVE